MEAFVAEQTDDGLKAAYTEMLNGCLAHPDKWVDWGTVLYVHKKAPPSDGAFF